MIADSFLHICDSICDDIIMLEDTLRELKTAPAIEESGLPQQGKSEIRGNIMLAYRHLEDARMRLRMVVKHAQGSTSNYDHSSTQGTDSQSLIND